MVTGATGIAAASARRLASEGARVAVLSRDAEECAELVRSLEGDGHRWSAVDLTDSSATASALDGIEPHGLFAVAGGSGRRCRLLRISRDPLTVVRRSVPDIFLAAVVATIIALGWAVVRTILTRQALFTRVPATVRR